MPKTYNIILILLLLQNCAPKLPEYKNMPKEKLTIPQQFSNQNQEKKSDIIKKHWKLFFKDEQLISLIDTALKNNQEINILNQEINIANNQVMARQGQYLPKVGIGAGFENEKNSKFTSKGASDAAVGLPENINNRQLGLTASWEIDIWKKLRNFAKSSYYEYLASIEGRNFAVTRLVSEIASDYYELMALDNQLDIIEQYLKTLQQSQQMVAWQQAAGRANSLAVKRFDAEVLKNQSRKYKIQQQIIITENHLNLILGRLPQAIPRESKKFQEIQMQDFETDIPATLLDNRPDVKQAALKLEATKLDVKAVKAQFYPSLNIDANLGYRSFNSNHFIDPASLIYNVAGNLTAPLINRNTIKAEYFSANSKQIQAIYNYERAFINAFTEVSNQLTSVENLKKIYDAKTKQTNILAESFDISNTLFKAARINYLESLITRRDYLESQMELTEVKQQQLAAYVNLYRALGGGWRQETQGSRLAP